MVDFFLIYDIIIIENEKGSKKMPVAKTYSKLELSGEPFKENGRMYINVIAPKGIKKVRWYTDAEYQRMYPDEQKENDIMDFNARHAFGFREPGYITIYRGDENLLEEFVESHRTSFWRNLTFNYYTPSHIEVPELPKGIEAIQLKWEEVQDHDDRMKPHEEVVKYIANHYSKSTNNVSAFQGQENDWLEKEVSITKNTKREDHFGEKHTHTMRDAEGNIYVWETGAKDFEVGMVIKLKMKVKAHKEINGEKCTIVWYCKEI